VTDAPPDPGPDPAAQPGAGPEPLLIDCDRCTARGPACPDCVVSVLLGPPPPLRLDPDELSALDTLAEAGLVPPLRLVRSLDPTAPDGDST
jgi:hypothetical protein